MDHPYATLKSNKRKLLANTKRQVEFMKFPLFEGMGTHFAYLYVGGPTKQRASVIVDTGSHHTAFPCVGCNCGVHMNPFYNPSISNSARIVKCNNQKERCRFSQAYSEGSIISYILSSQYVLMTQC